MSLGDLPVDNLYKFAALSGVALVGFLLWLSWKTLRELQSTLLALAIKTARVAAAQKQHEDLQKIDDSLEAILQNRVKALSAELQSHASGQISELETKKKELIAELKASIEANRVRIKEVNETRGEMNAVQAEIDALSLQQQVFRRTRNRYLVGACVALAWSVAGFGFWYVKLQQPLDEKLQLDIQVIRAALQAPKPPNTTPPSAPIR